MAINDTLDSLL